MVKKILVTGSTGFLGTNFINAIHSYKDDIEIYGYNSGSLIEEIDDYTKDCDFVFNFAAVHRPKNGEEFVRVNAHFFQQIIDCLEKNHNDCPVLYTSSVQANDDSLYGKSKVYGERILKAHSEKCGSKGIIYRLTNTFGAYARPNGHSVVATFCNNIAKGMPIMINNPNHIMHLQYVGDVVTEFLKIMTKDIRSMYDYYEIPSSLIYDVSLQELADTIYKFENVLAKGEYPYCENEFQKKLLLTYMFYRRNE